MRAPIDVLFAHKKAFPILPAVDHYAGSEKMIRKALGLQNELGAIFDITCDCEDGAQVGNERQHAEMAAAMIMSEENRHGRLAVRIHDVTHPHWQQDMAILIKNAGSRLPFITLPKPCSARDVHIQLDALRAAETKYGIKKPIPAHVLIETLGALREVWQIAALPHVESLDFGLMDFVSDHHGAIPESAMKSPGQFEHPLIVRAKSEISTAALANGIVSTHNVTTQLNDEAIIFNDASRARNEFGCLRMWSIHPNQIMPIIKAMRPEVALLEKAAAVLVAAQDANWGPISHEGQLHDRASYRYYWDLMLRANAMGMEMTIPTSAKQRFFAADAEC